MKSKNFRKRTISEDSENLVVDGNNDADDDQERRLTLEEVKFLQKQREKKSGILAITAASQAVGTSNGVSTSLVIKGNEKNEGDGEKDDLVLQDTFAQETAVMVEDPNMLRYVEQELAKKRGRNIEMENQAANDVKRAEDELYSIPEHLKVKRRNSEESSTQWTTGIAEIQLPMEYKLKNIEETEAAKKLLQEKRLVGRTKTESIIPSSYSADYFQRGKDYAERLRRGWVGRRLQKMNQLLGASIAAGIKCRPYTVSPMTRMPASLQARSFMNRKEGYIPIGKIELDCPQAMKDDKLRVWFGSAFTGEVEKRYLDYLGKLDWESLNNHVTFFPRKHRSKDEKRLIFENWAAHFGKKYPSAEFKKKRYATFKAELGRIDILNSRYNYANEMDRTTDIFGYPFTCFVPRVFPYWLKGIQKPYHSYTPKYFCELTHTHKEEYDLAKERWVNRNGKMYVISRDNEVYEIP